jgi:LysM repeat protein
MLQKKPLSKNNAETPPAPPPPAEAIPDIQAMIEPEPPKPEVEEPKPQPKTAPPAYIHQRPPTQMISSYRKRQQIGPFIIWGLVALLIVGGLIILITWIFSQGSPLLALLATDTPTPTLTYTPTSSPTATSTATETPTPTVTLTPTASAPFLYEIQSGDTLYALKEKYSLADDFLCTIAALNPNLDINNISPGQKITLPNPGLICPTPTPIDLTTLSRGKEITYTIQAGDTLAGIASQFNSTEEDIIAKNKLTDANTIFIGQEIIVRVNLVTPTVTSAPTITPGATVTPSAPALETPSLTPTP